MEAFDRDRLETARLVLEKLTTHDVDAAFMLELVNEPGWIRFIGDRKVRSIEEARAYLVRGAVGGGEKSGFFQYRVSRKSDGVSLGTCGLLKRDSLPDPDLGFAFLARFGGHGYARESALAVMDLGKRAYGLKRIVGITLADNAGSIRVLEGVGMKHEATLPPHEGESDELELYAWNAT